MKRSFSALALHPALFASFPFLSFYAANRGQLFPGDPTVRALLMFNAVVLLSVWLIAFALLRDPLRASLFASPIVLFFFSFGHLLDPLEGVGIKRPISFGPEKILGFGIILLTVVLFFLIRRTSLDKVKLWSKLMLIAGVALVGSSSVALAQSELDQPEVTEGRRYSTPVEGVEKQRASELPDIYYILLDSYQRSDILKDVLGYDNSWFTDRLTEQGFFVADKSNSNYAHTFLSVPSTLHMKYMNYLTDELGEKTRSNIVPLLMIDDNQVARVTKALGYKNVVVGSGWFKTKKNNFADVVANSANNIMSLGPVDFAVDQTSMVYVLNTALQPFVEDRITRGLHREVLKAFDTVERIPFDPKPTFTFAHITIPHPPFLFDSEGRWIDSTAEVAGDEYTKRDPYIEQLIYTSKRTLPMLDKIINRSKQPPIIVVASDHGSTINLGHPYGWGTPQQIGDTGIRERMGILNAYYFPDGNYKRLYPSISPVNTFRVILDQYLAQRFRLLPDRSYFTNNRAFYKFYDVTDIVAESEPHR